MLFGMNYLLNFLLQSILASLICCFADSAIAKRPLFTKRSYCFHCTTQLNWYQLIPIFSAFFQSFRCSKCHATFTSKKQWVFFELFFPITMALVAPSFEPQYWLVFPLLFLAREDSQALKAHSDWLFLVVPIVYLQSTTSCLTWMKFWILIEVLILIFLHKLGFGDLPVLLIAMLAFTDADFLLFIAIASCSALLDYLCSKKMNQSLPFLPFLLLSWLILLLKNHF